MFESALAVIGGVLGIAVLLGAAFAAFRASDLRSTVRDQQARIEALITDRDELMRERDAERQERSLLTRRLELAEERVKNLEEIVSGRIDFTALETALLSHHTEAGRRFDDVEACLTDIKALLDAKRIGDQS